MYATVWIIVLNDVIVHADGENEYILFNLEQ